uniref:Uncharacterized protein n=1 Tax=Lepeophtheirus salmonis TaxID=72036 RepID=A0A0K2U7U0_LEPSM
MKSPSLDNLGHTALKALAAPGDLERIQLCHCTGNGLFQDLHRRMILCIGIMLYPSPEIEIVWVRAVCRPKIRAPKVRTFCAQDIFHFFDVEVGKCNFFYGLLHPSRECN